MEFSLGFFSGLVVSALIFSILAFFRAGIEKKLIVIEKTLGNAGPKPQGFIVEPVEDAELIRQEIIEKNKREGRDTKLSDLQ